MNEELTSAALTLLEDNTKQKAVYTTSDGYHFFSERAAQNHANGLKDKELVKVCRPGEAEQDEVKVAPAATSHAQMYGDDVNPLPQPAVEYKQLEDFTVAEVTEWAQTVTDKDELEAALVVVHTKGGKKAIEGRLEALKEPETPETPDKTGDNPEDKTDD